MNSIYLSRPNYKLYKIYGMFIYSKLLTFISANKFSLRKKLFISTNTITLRNRTVGLLNKTHARSHISGDAIICY